MRITVLGAGAMGGSVARLLARHDDVDLRVVDADSGRADAAVAAAGRGEARRRGSPTAGSPRTSCATPTPWPSASRTA